MGAIWLNNIRLGGVYMFCMQPLLVCFDISSNESQTIFGLVCDSVYVG